MGLVFGMGIELALILGTMGTVWTGNPLSLDPGFSIGGTVAGDETDNILGNLAGLLGIFVVLQGSLSHVTLILTQVILEACRVHTIGSSPILLLREMICM